MAIGSFLVQEGVTGMPVYWTGPRGLEVSGERAYPMHYEQPGVSLQGAIARHARACQVRSEDYDIFRNPVHLPTALIEYWFGQVCEMWSTFDSDVNRNRQIASNTWTTSEAVFCTLQAMSASCLVDSMPLLQNSLPSLVSQAIAVVNHRMLVLRSLPVAETGNVAIDLVFAVFALGTSLHWSEPSVSGDSLLSDARILLDLWESSSHGPDLLPLAYFQQALIYWEMLHCVTNSNSGHVKLNERRRKYQDRLRYAMGMNSDAAADQIIYQQLPESPKAFQGTRPNSWCGLSSEVIDLFGQTLALYRNARDRQRQRKASTAAATRDAVCDIGIAHELLRELLAMNFDDTVRSDELLGFSLHTGDQKTPLTHLKKIAEAYHLASLLQLYLAFDDLDIEPLTDRARSTGANSVGVENFVPSGTMSRPQTLVLLALKLIKILEQIPAESGSRCMQPVLYISAAAALKSEIDPAPGAFFQETDSLVGVNSDECADMSTSYLCGWQPDQASFDDLSFLQTSTPTVTQANLEISRARHFIMKRLSLLQQTLPSRPMGVATNLVKAIWATYDNEIIGLDQLHWLDIMMDTGLQTLFR
ncbi:hypothetical protein LTR37_019478 [Vermiconidia calcicola]|uniref:Uncharacterized protein n=1 Tax=Vermiconidia calcicola TaxID=1690605 RepID=A0ACC3MFH1_9PEZI|nr:hypothetical protein LTR37_019478 [Vermiconidia calcicola]